MSQIVVPKEPENGLRVVQKFITTQASRLAWSPDGKLLATGGQIRIWSLEREEPLLQLGAKATALAFSPDSRTLAWLDSSGSIGMWEVESGRKPRQFDGPIQPAAGIAWTPDGRQLLTAMNNPATRRAPATRAGPEWRRSLRLVPEDEPFAEETVPRRPAWLSPRLDQGGVVMAWDVESGVSRAVAGVSQPIIRIALSPDGKALAVGCEDDSIVILDTETWSVRHKLEVDTQIVCMTWSPESRTLVAGLTDAQIRVWHASTGKEIRRLESHTTPVAGLSFSGDGDVLASRSRDGLLQFWQTGTWTPGAGVDMPLWKGAFFTTVAFHPASMQLAVTMPYGVVVLEVGPTALLSTGASYQYASAKVVLIGETNVGKTCLARALRAEDFDGGLPTTHGMQLWPFTPHELGEPDSASNGVHREIVLWDLGGQEWYQLVHQLFLPETTVVVLVVDPTRGQDTLDTIRKWDRSAANSCIENVRKILVGAKMDGSLQPIDEAAIRTVQEELGYSPLIKTSAVKKWGLDDLRRAIRTAIDWGAMTPITRREVFDAARRYLLHRRQEGTVVLEWAELARDLKWNPGEGEATYNAVVQSLKKQGLVVDVTLGGGRRILILQPEVVNTLAGSVVVAAMEDPRKSGAVEEYRLLEGRIPRMAVPMDPSDPTVLRRLPPKDERDVMEAVIQLFLQHGLAFRHAGLLCLPAMFRLNPEPLDEGTIETPVHYSFTGAVNNIYSQLVVQFSYSERFTRVGLWENRALFEHRETGARCGIGLHKQPNGEARIDAFFPRSTPMDDRVLFTKYVEEHLRNNGHEVETDFTIACDKCGYEFNDADVKANLRDHIATITCRRGHVTNIEEAVISRRQSMDTFVLKTSELRTEINEALTLAVTSPRQDVLLVHLHDDLGKASKAVGLLRANGLSVAAMDWNPEWRSNADADTDEFLLHYSGVLAVYVGVEGWAVWQNTGVESWARRFARAGRPLLLVSDSWEPTSRGVPEDIPVSYWTPQSRQPLPGILDARRQGSRNEPAENDPIRILHLSDLHFGADTDPEALLVPLVQDLRAADGLDLKRLDYIVISGDVSQHAAPDEYKRAVTFTMGLRSEFDVPVSRLIVVPGNHEVDWTAQFWDPKVERTVNKANLKEGTYISAGPILLVRHEQRYLERFRNFSQHYLQPIINRGGWADPGEQFEVLPFPDDGLVFLGLNSAWEIDESFPQRASIDQAALVRALQQVSQLNAGREKPLLGICIWHHGLLGEGSLKNLDFLELLRREGFRIALTGHVHRDVEEELRIHRPPSFNAVGAGAFGAIMADLPPATPNLYNVLEIARDLGSIRVSTRAKPRTNGGWGPHYAYGSHNDRDWYYTIQLNKRKPRGRGPH